MPAALTHTAIMLLARDRIADLRDRLQTKVGTGITVTDLEHRMLYLAIKAYEMMSDNELTPPSRVLPTGAGYPDPFGRGVSKFAVMGAMGPDIPAFGGILAPGQGWIFDTVHKGTPDSDRELVVARTTDLATQLWFRATVAIGERPDGGDEGRAAKARARRAVRAYVLGHLCHLAGDIISHPFINDIEWHARTAEAGKLSHEGGEGSIDAQVARSIYRRASTRSGEDWSPWWPDFDDVPSELFRAYDEALEAMYHVRSKRPAGMGAFEKAFADLEPPPASLAFIKDAYSVYRNAAIGMVYDWGRWRWWLFLMPAALVLMAAVPLMLALPHGSRVMGRSIADWEERTWSELLTLPLSLGAGLSTFYGTYVASLTTHGNEGLVGFGLASAWLSLIAAVAFFATLGVDENPGWLRWGVLFGVPAAAAAIMAIISIRNLLGEHRERRGFLALIFALPLALAVVGFLLSWVASIGTVSFGIVTAVMILGIGLVWFLITPTIRDARIPEEPVAFSAQRPHLVRLFDDATLTHEAPFFRLPGAGVPTLAERLYPSGARALLKLWWDGAGELHLRARSTHVEVSFTGDGAPVQTVPLPGGPMTAEELGRLLSRTVRDNGGTVGHLHFAVAFPSELVTELPAGAMLASGGDRSRGSPAEAAEASERYVKLAASEADAGTVVFHAPKAVQSVRFSRNGPVPFDPRGADTVTGPGKVRSDGNRVIGDDTLFHSFFAPGDTLRARGQSRIVTQVVSNTELRVASGFAPALPADSEYAREGLEVEPRDGYSYVPDTRVSVLGGNTLMQLAGDFAAMLCLGAVPDMLDLAQQGIPGLAGKQNPANQPVDARVHPIHQVFRNWSLDRRRVNEWRMLVLGGAVSEKGRDPAARDSAMPLVDANWTAAMADPAVAPRTADGERVSRAQGWVPLFRRWLDMAANPASNAADATGAGPTNRDLSRAVAFLFDLPDPVPVHTA